MPKRVLDENDEEEFKEEDISDEGTKRRRRRHKKDGAEKPKAIDDTFLPSSQRKWRACVYCRLVLNQEKWGKLHMCPNCPDSRGIEDTTDQFESLISLILPKKSWVA